MRKTTIEWNGPENRCFHLQLWLNCIPAAKICLQATRLQATRLQATRLQEYRMKFRPHLIDLEARTVPTVDPTGYDPNAIPIETGSPSTISPDGATQIFGTSPQPNPKTEEVFRILARLEELRNIEQEIDRRLIIEINTRNVLGAQLAALTDANKQLKLDIADAKKASKDTTQLENQLDKNEDSIIKKKLEIGEQANIVITLLIDKVTIQNEISSLLLKLSNLR